MKREKIVFGTKSNKKLLNYIVRQKGFRKGKVKFVRLADQEILPMIEENVKGLSVFVLGSGFYPSDNLLELLFLINALKVNGARKIKVAIPYFAYAKSDKLKPEGAPLTARYVVRAIELAGASSVVVVNLHSRRVEKFFSVLCLHLSVVGFMAEKFRKSFGNDFVVVSPDFGGVARAKEFAEILGQKRIVKIEKIRSGFDKARVVSVRGKVEGRNVVLVDDMVQSGQTILEAVRALKKRGVKEIYVVVVHFLFAHGVMEVFERNNDIEEVWISNTVYDDKEMSKKFRRVNINKEIVDIL